MLTGQKIYDEVQSGNIIIDKFNPDFLQPNSYDLHWGNEIKVVKYNATSEFERNNLVYPIIDMMEPQLVEQIIIPEDGILLWPNSLYLIPTVETVGSSLYVPQIVGRSSIGRMGIQVSQHAAFGDIGFVGKWTLQVSVIYPTRIYPNLRVCHVFFEEPCGTVNASYHGRYQYSIDAQESKFIE